MPTERRAPPIRCTSGFRGSWVGLEQRFEWHASDAVRLTVGGEGQLHFQSEQQAADNSGTFLDESRPYEIGAAYALFDGRLNPALRLSAGARLDVYSTFGESINTRVARSSTRSSVCPATALERLPAVRFPIFATLRVCTTPRCGGESCKAS